LKILFPIIFLFPLFTHAEELIIPDITEIPCSESTVFGQTLGTSRIKGKVELVSPYKTSLLMDSKIQVADFSSIDVRITPKTSRVIGASGAIGVKGKEDVLKLRDMIRAKIELTMSVSEKKYDVLKDTMTFYTGKTKSCIGKSCYYSDGLRIELYTTDNLTQGLHGVYLSCTDLTLESLQFKEFMQD
jgi:hypothetical protein